jgi:hypothetical protein
VNRFTFLALVRGGLPFDGSAAPIIPPAPGVSPDAGTPPAAHARYLWAVLIARIYAILPLLCPVCGSDLRPIAAVTEPEPVRRILLHVGEPPLPPPISPARSPLSEMTSVGRGRDLCAYRASFACPSAAG